MWLKEAEKSGLGECCVMLGHHPFLSATSVIVREERFGNRYISEVLAIQIESRLVNRDIGFQIG